MIGNDAIPEQCGGIAAEAAAEAGIDISVLLRDLARHWVDAVTIEGDGGMRYLPLENVHLVLLNSDGWGDADVRVPMSNDVSSSPVVFVRDDADLDVVCRRIRAGACRFFPAGTQEERIREARRELARSDDGGDGYEFVCEGPTMRALDLEITRLARLQFDVLLFGETGVGKDVVAREIHRRSSRSRRPFVSIPLRSLSETLLESELFGFEKGSFSGAMRMKPGKLEAAQYGTIYIPEISCLDPEVQLKLLYFMQYKRVSRIGQDPRTPERRLDVRLVFATNERLESLLESGRLRRDFYYRVTGVKLEVPPLRERSGGIAPLVRHFVDKYSIEMGRTAAVVSPDAMAKLAAYAWPGNVRELENVVKAALARTLGDTLDEAFFPAISADFGSGKNFAAILEHLPDPLPVLRDLEQSLVRAYLSEALRRTKNRIVDAARLCGMTVQGFRKALKRFGISAG